MLRRLKVEDLQVGGFHQLRSRWVRENQPGTVTCLELEQGKNMYRVMKSSFGFAESPASGDTCSDGSSIHPDDLWLFTDPTARAIYSQQGRLDQLKQDIRTYVRRESQWDPDEVDFKRELQRLLKAGLIVPEPAFGHLSPHPTIYQAIEEGAIEIAGERHAFDIGDQIVFASVINPLTWVCAWPRKGHMQIPVINSRVNIGVSDLPRNPTSGFMATSLIWRVAV